MNTFKRASLIAAVVAAFATFATTATPVMAQTPAQQAGTPKPPAATPAPRFDHHRNMEPRAFSKPTERIEASLAYQRTALKITPQQQTQWDRYAADARKQAQEMEQRFAAMPPHGTRTATPPPNAIERLERQQAMLSQASTRLGERLAAQKPLYAVLSPEQKKVADQVLNPRRGDMMGRHGGGERGESRHDTMSHRMMRG